MSERTPQEILTELAEAGYKNASLSCEKLDDMLEAVKMVRQNRYRFKMMYSKMLTALKKGDVERASQVFRNEHPPGASFLREIRFKL